MRRRRLSSKALPVARVFAGGYHTCALSVDGDLLCFGEGNGGKLGQGDERNILNPEDVDPIELSERVVDVSLGDLFTCAVLESGLLRCFGAPTGTGQGQRGDNLILAPLDAAPVRL